MALKNARAKKRVHFIALEASHLEVQKRIAFNQFARIFYKDPERLVLEQPLNYPDFCVGKYQELIKKYDVEVMQKINRYSSLKIHYGGFNFKVADMERMVFEVSHETDLIVIDHAHYFDLDDERDENKAMRKIAKVARRLTQELKIPIVLIAHLRKRQGGEKTELVPGIEEFHGSSDLPKIATKAITLSNGPMLSPTRQVTYLRISKNRLDGSVRNYIGKMIYDFKRGDFDDRFTVGRLSKDGRDFVPLGKEDVAWPYWLKKE
jgi:hypothetical protein